jgi:glutaredoxin
MNELDNNNVLIYSKNNCSYCTKSKQLLNSLNIDFKEICLNPDDKDYYDAIVNMLKNKYNHKTFPFIIVNNIFIGGYSELEQAYATNYLHKLLNLDSLVDF